MAKRVRSDENMRMIEQNLLAGVKASTQGWEAFEQWFDRTYPRKTAAPGSQPKR